MAAREIASEIGHAMLHEEVARITRTRRVTGRVRVAVETSETVEQVAAARTTRRYDVEHRTVDREVTEDPGTRQDGDTLVIPVVEERLVLVRKLFVIEEIRLRLRVEEEPVSLPVTLRRQQAVVTRLPPGDDTPSQPTTGPLEDTQETRT